MKRRYGKRRAGTRKQDHRAKMRELNAVESERWTSKFAVVCGDCGYMLGRATDQTVDAESDLAQGRFLFFVYGALRSDDGIWRFSNDVKKRINNWQDPRYRRGWHPTFGGAAQSHMSPESYPCQVMCPRCDIGQLIDADELGLGLPPVTSDEEATEGHVLRARDLRRAN